MELISCGCKTGQTSRCRCRKNELLCTEMCRCKDCENTDIEFDEPDYVADLDLDDGSYVSNFQSMKSPVALNSLLPKLFCYITWFVLSPDYTRNWTTGKRGLYVKFYCFFETIA